MNIDELTESLSNTVIISLHNPSPYHLYMNNRALYTEGLICGEMVIGEITGNQVYIWETQHNEYILIENELVLDIQQNKKNMLNHVREENCSNNPSNCYIHMVVRKDGSTHFYLCTKQDIFPHEELVYSIFDFKVTYE